MAAQLPLLPPELWIEIALASDPIRAEYSFNFLARAIPALGRWTISGGDGAIISRKYDLMETFGYTVKFHTKPSEDKLYEGIIWLKHNHIHRNDQPACISVNNTQEWCKHGCMHRAADSSGYIGPAYINQDAQEWYENGELHRAPDSSGDHGPAVVRPNHLSWYINGVRHRDGGPAFVGFNGHSQWYQYGKLHRDGGPAVILPTGQAQWRQYGLICRKDGPAIINPDGTRVWCLCANNPPDQANIARGIGDSWCRNTS